MTITLTLPSETETRLRERAAAAGQTVEVYVQRLVEQVVTPAPAEPLLSALVVAPRVPAAWVDELEALIGLGERAPSSEDPFAEGA